MSGEGGDLITDDNYQYLRFQRYFWNGWFDSDGIQQTVSVVPGETYSLSCIYRVNAGGTRDKQDAKRHIRMNNRFLMKRAIGKFFLHQASRQTLKLR